MRKGKDYWISVYDMFCRDYPELAEEMVDWYPSAQFEIAIKLRNDCRYVYNMLTKVAYNTYDPDEDYELSDEEWKRIFSKRLDDKLRIMHVTQTELAEMTGISQVMISKYITCKAIPSCTNMRKIARALKCSTGEFMNE